MIWMVRLLLCLSLLTPMFGVAHESRPAYLELTETETEVFDVLWKRPSKSGKVLALRVSFPSHCRELSPVVDYSSPGAYEQHWQIDCSEQGLAGQSVAIVGLDRTITDVLVRVEFTEGIIQQRLLRAAEPELVIQPHLDRWQVIGDYLRLGVEHILGGPDHLLFVLGLLILVRTPRHLVATVTAFTIAHSLTLGAATLGWVRIPQAPVEAVIALSIVFLASEVLRTERGGDGLTYRAPWLVAFSFGLLHGLGFAAALEEVGLPSQAIPLALLMFNLGVELGQLAFIAVVLMGCRLFLQRISIPPGRINEASAYGMGSVAAFWVIERVIVFG